MCVLGRNTFTLWIEKGHISYNLIKSIVPQRLVQSTLLCIYITVILMQKSCSSEEVD